MKQITQLKMGIKVEREHKKTIRTLQGKDRKYSTDEAAALIAHDHLREDTKYYTKLRKAKL